MDGKPKAALQKGGRLCADKQCGRLTYWKCFRVRIRQKCKTTQNHLFVLSLHSHWWDLKGFIFFILSQVGTSQCRCVWLCIYAWNKVKCVVCPFFNVSFFFQSFSSSSQKLLLLLQFLCTIYQRWKAELGFSWKSNIFKVVQTISSEVLAYWTFSVQVAPNITQCTKQ